MTRRCVAGIDQGTTGTTVLLLDEQERLLGRGACEIPQSYPAPGQVEHDPDALIDSVARALAQALAQAPDAQIAAVGITNQRETTIVWDRKTGRAIAPAIVWQDRRTAPACAALREAGHEPAVQRTTGLLLDPYFSATKVAWLLDHVQGARARAEAGQLAFGTVDSWLVHRLSGGCAHVTEASNASRTLLYDLRAGRFSDDMCALFDVPRALLPDVVPTVGPFATTSGFPGLPDGTPILAVAGDQQAALYGQGCVQPGDAKCTFGTGSFLLAHIGDDPLLSRHRLLTSVAWSFGGATSYALEGGAFVCGALVQWLRDGLGIIKNAADIETLARSVPDAGGVVIVPALAGLGAPHWRADARGIITGITRGTTAAHLARATLEAMALQNVELVRAMEADSNRPIAALRVDGGATANDLLMQLQADFLGVDVIRPRFVELTALGAARLAAHGLDLAPPPRDDSTVTRFTPRTSADARDEALARFQSAVAKA